MKYNKDLYNESEKLYLKRNEYLLKAQEEGIILLIKEMLSDITKYYSKKEYSSDNASNNNYCLAILVNSGPSENNKYFNLIESILKLRNSNYFKNAYALDITPSIGFGDNEVIIGYRVEWDYETYYRKIQERIKVKEKSKLK